MSNDKAEFSRYKSLIDGDRQSILDNEKISQAFLSTRCLKVPLNRSI